MANPFRNVLIFCGLLALTACGAPPHLSISKISPGVPMPRSPSAQATEDLPQRCALPPSLAGGPAASTLPDTDALLRRLNPGKYRLAGLTVYQDLWGPAKSDVVPTHYLGSFQAEVHPAQDTLADAELDLGCSDWTVSEPIVSLIQLTIPSALYAPSGRVTIFDESSGGLDNPGFNFPSLMDLIVTSDRSISFHSAVERLGGPPYRKHVTLAEAMGDLPGALLEADANEGFSIRWVKTELRGELRKQTQALATYSKARN